MVHLHQFPVPLEGIHYQNGHVRALVDTNDLGNGTLYIAESCVSWISSSGDGFLIPYPKMTLHAVSRDPNVHSNDCLYVMVNGYLDDEDAEAEVDPENEIDPDEVITEVRFVPDEPEILDLMYSSVQECTLLHPDPSSDMSDAEAEEEVDLNEQFEGVGGGGGGDDEFVEEEEETDSGFHRMMSRFGGGDGNGSAPPENFDPDQFADAE